MISPRSRQRQGNTALLIILVVIILAVRGWIERAPPSGPSTVSTPVNNPIEEMLQPVTAASPKDGIAAAILIDTSGSMREKIRDVDGTLQPKIEIARRAVVSIADQFDSYAREHTEKPIMLGIYEFSDRRRLPPARPVVPIGPPDADAARSAVLKMFPDGDTPIGDAMILAKKDIDATGLSKRHILVVTDGENTKGYSPRDVTRVILSQSENDRASIYFVAFDVATVKFDAVRDAGGLVLAASNETDLKGNLDYLLTGKILAEQPESK